MFLQMKQIGGKKHSVVLYTYMYVVGKLAGRAVAWIGDKISV